MVRGGGVQKGGRVKWNKSYEKGRERVQHPQKRTNIIQLFRIFPNFEPFERWREKGEGCLEN